MDFTLDALSSVAIYEGAVEAAATGAVARGRSGVELEQSLLGILQTVAGWDDHDADGEADFAQSTQKMNPQSPGRTKRWRRCHWFCGRQERYKSSPISIRWLGCI
ncbi:uncharacterized protein LOC124683769 isoform X2 [Lolium rigidum]|uniref:uncharacterized protein LOC124683769 isoform X2 n=1 Tax=Lolium rigidum TaxID=89674 RepID=UPI001F5D440C|nr:uncharacterized protein LOC124683769 isoform X2 [Lolium rigidum]